ncbi:MAG: protoporphyrinogen oxidase [Fuerstiella sp.]
MTSGHDALPPDGTAPGAHRVAIIGGGITGLAAAHRLISLNDRVQVALFEGSQRPGGIIQTQHRDGFLIELGPDSFITNKPGGVRLCEEIGFSDQLIPTDNRFRRSLVLRKGRPRPVPDGFMLMAPARAWPILTTPVLSVRGKLRLLGEAFIPGRTLDDESLADFVRRRFGKQALDRLVQPLVGGIYTSDPEKLSLRATLPRFPDMERDYGSVIRGTLATQKSKTSNASATSGSGARYGLFTTPADGLSSLIAALVQTLTASGRVDFRTSVSVDGLVELTDAAAQDTSGTEQSAAWRVQCSDGSAESFHDVIITVPTHRAASLLKSTSLQPLAESLQQIEYASSAVAVTAHRLKDFSHPLDAFGLVIPHIENRRVLAVSFASRKFPNRAPEGHVLLRTFVGGAMQPELLQQDDSQILAMVQEELKNLLGMKSPPLFSQLVRYQNAMPQYHVGHLSRVAQIEQLLQQHPGLHLAGSAYHGVGIPDSITSGRAAAEHAVERAGGTAVTESA